MTTDNSSELSYNKSALDTNTCRCGNTLRALSNGHYHSTGFPVKYICCICANHKVNVKG